RNPPEIPDSCLPAGLREFARVCTAPNRLTEDPVLRSTIRHHTGPLIRQGFFLPRRCRHGAIARPRPRVHPRRMPDPAAHLPPPPPGSVLRPVERWHGARRRAGDDHVV